MIKCPNCGTENEEAAKFCINCGNKIPHEKECPKCHSKMKPEAKFCMECGYNFAAPSAPAGGLSMGDKNVIAGDVIGSQNDYRGATIVKNEDETKKMVKCHVCGRNIMIVQAISCPECGLDTCENCFDAEENMCSSCISQKRENKETVYTQALQKVFEDGKVTFAERQELNALQRELGIAASRATELEKLSRNGVSAKAAETLSGYVRLSLEKALDVLYDEGDAQSAYEKLEPLYKRYPQNEEILTGFLNAAIQAKPEEALAILRQNQADVLGFKLILIDYALANGDLNEADMRLQEALVMWPESLLLACRKALCLKAMYDEIQDKALLEQAAETLAGLGEAQSKLESSWLCKAQCAIYGAMGDEVPNITPKYCEEHNLYYALCREFAQKAGYTEDGKEHQFPDGITEIKDRAFEDHTGLTSVVIPNSVTKIGFCAFGGCTGLTSVVIPDSVTEIGLLAFAACTGLTSVVIPDSVTEIEDDAFEGCTGLQKPLIWKGILLWWGNPQGKIVIPDSVTEIGADAFFCCMGLTSIVIPNSVTKIEAGAFSGCTGLTSVVIPDSVTEIGRMAFGGCSNLTSVVIPNSVTKIERAFFNCTGLTNVVIPSSVTEIGYEAFSGCTGLTSVMIPDSVKTIADNAFEGCNATVLASVKRWRKASSASSRS